MASLRKENRKEKKERKKGKEGKRKREGELGNLLMSGITFPDDLYQGLRVRVAALVLVRDLPPHLHAPTYTESEPRLPAIYSKQGSARLNCCDKTGG